MSTPDTNNIGVKLQSAGENFNTWGDPNLNNDLIILSNLASKWNPLTINGDTTISETNYSPLNDTEVATIDLVTGTVTAAFNLVFPSRDKRILLRNSTGFQATCKLSATTGFTLPTGRTVLFATDGSSDAYNLSPNYGGVSVGANGSDILNMTGVQALITAASSGIAGGFALNFFYTAAGGETSKSGVDDNGLTLAYTAGTATEVFLNGVKLIPSSDYVANTGTSITSLTALSAGDILHVRAWAVFSAANTYTQAQTNALFASPPVGVGSSVPPTGAFTTLTASGTVSGAGFTARFASPGPIGNTAPGTGAFTSLTSSTGIANASLATMNTKTIKANLTGGSAVPTDATVAQISALFTPPTTQVFLTGSGTYTTPSNVTWIEVTLLGGGGGGGGAGAGAGTGGTGGNTTFSTLTANGAAGGNGAGGGGAGGTGVNGDLNVTGGTGAFGLSSGAFAWGGAGAGSGAGLQTINTTNGNGVSAVANTGAGGSGAGNQATGSGGGGGQGGLVVKIITSPSASYSYGVGAGGTAGAGAQTGGIGGSGLIRVVEHYT